MRPRRFFFSIAAALFALSALPSAVQETRAAASAVVGHNAGQDCLVCHTGYKAAGTVFKDLTAAAPQPGAGLRFLRSDGAEISLPTNSDGNLAIPDLPDGRYIIRLNAGASRAWHIFPGQGSCNTCHMPGGNASLVRTKAFPSLHTQIPEDNDCRNCHHFPASQSYAQLKTPGVLNASAAGPPVPSSRIDILGRVFNFDPAQYEMKTARPDIFAPGYFSMFDVILAVAARNGIKLSARFDPACMTYFIRTIDGRSGGYWYHFCYDVGADGGAEIGYRRANRWDEALWRPGVGIKVVEGENLAELRAEYMEEIVRERTQGHVIPSVQISINPSNYRGNPPGSDRITVSRSFQNLKVTSHDLRSTGASAPYSRPFRPGVVTSLDILLTLRDQGALDVVTGAFFTYFAGHFIDSFYVVALGFPGIGTAHSSGRQGFVYVTENGTPNRLPNNADGKLHMTSDINVLHAPDFSTWRWAELGNPYYESREPGAAALIEESVQDDFNAIDRGFNLHVPVLAPDRRGTGSRTGASIDISYNVFEPGPLKLFVRASTGRTVATLLDGGAKDIGIRKLRWSPGPLMAGEFSLVMTNGKTTQTRLVKIGS